MNGEMNALVLTIILIVVVIIGVTASIPFKRNAQYVLMGLCILASICALWLDVVISLFLLVFGGITIFRRELESLWGGKGGGL